MKLATLCYVRKAGKTLMLHRVKRENDIHQDKWNGLGGKFQSGETPEACVIREVEEESGLLIKDPKIRGFLTFPEFGAGEDWYVFVFLANEFSGNLIDSSEGNLQWIENDQLLMLNLWEGDQYFLPWLDKEVFFSARFYYKNGNLLDHDMVIYPIRSTDKLNQQGEKIN